jgi:hypothetical protein
MLFMSLIMTLPLIAQTEQGNLLLGGTLGAYSTSTGTGNRKATQSGFSVVPRIGFFASNNLAIGIGIGYSSSKIKEPFELDISSNVLEVNPFGRYYVDISDKFKFFGEFGINLRFGATYVDRGTIDPEPLRSRSIEAYIRPGFVFFPSQKFGIELTISGISYANVDPDTGFDGATFNVFNIGASKDLLTNQSNTFVGNSFLNPQLGIYFYF